MGLFGIALPAHEVVPVATDVLSTNVQKENAARVKAELDAREAPNGPEMSARDRLKLGGQAQDFTQGFSPANASQFTAGIPLRA